MASSADSFEEQKVQAMIPRLPALNDGEGCVILEFAHPLSQDKKHKHFFPSTYIIVYAKGIKCSLKSLLTRALACPDLNHSDVSKNTARAIEHSGGKHSSGQSSNESLLPGLHDDIALSVLAWTSRSDYSTLASLNKSFYSLISSGYLYKLRREMGRVEQWIYLACISMSWEAFDPIRHRWMTLPRVPCDACFVYGDKESLAVGTKLLVFGREIPGFTIWMYSLVTNAWTKCPHHMNLPRCLFGSSSAGKFAIVAGGADRFGRIVKAAELYNSELGTWHTLPDMNVERKLCAGFFMDRKFYVVGGVSSNRVHLTCGEEYNLETGTWRRIESMYPNSSEGMSTRPPPLVAVVNNQLYSVDQETNFVKKYDKENNTWRVVKRMPVRADSLNGWGVAFKGCCGRLMVIGGHRGRSGEEMILYSWKPGFGDGEEDDGWDILCMRGRAGTFVYNCAIMGC